MRRTPMSWWAGVAGLALLHVLGGAASAAPGREAEAVRQLPGAQGAFAPFTPEQLDNLVAPIALYADPLLAQVLLAATFPDQIAAAAQYVRANGIDSVDDQAWDVSVKAVAHYPTVLNTLDSRMDWTTSLGQAYAAQSTEVMRAVQRMRRMAQAQGNLVSSSEQEVVADDGFVRIWPANPRLIYVPVYDPAVVFVRPVFVRPGFHAFYSFGLPFPIGAWLIYDWDWPAWRIVYTGWQGGGWIARSRPYVRITNVYVNPVHRRVWFGREVMLRRPDYGRVRSYDALHPGVRFGDRNRGATPGYVVPRSRQPSAPDRQRRAVPRGDDRRGAGIARAPTPLPEQTRPRVEYPFLERRAGQRPAVETPRPVQTETRPRVDYPFLERPAAQRPAGERPRWTPESRPSERQGAQRGWVDRGRPVPGDAGRPSTDRAARQRGGDPGSRAGQREGRGGSEGRRTAGPRR